MSNKYARVSKEEIEKRYGPNKTISIKEYEEKQVHKSEETKRIEQEQLKQKFDSIDPLFEIPQTKVINSPSSPKWPPFLIKKKDT